MNMQVTPQQCLFWASEQCQNRHILSKDCRVVRLFDWVDLENFDALMIPHGKHDEAAAL